MDKGDHIKVHRGAYWHHGIYIGNGRVVHFTDGPRRSAGPRINMTSLTEFIGNDACPVVVSPCATLEEADKVVSRAKNLIGEGGYRLFSYNCEHFAYYCRTGAKHDFTDPYMDQIKELRFDILGTKVPLVNDIPAISSLAAIAIGTPRVLIRLLTQTLLHGGLRSSTGLLRRCIGLLCFKKADCDKFPRSQSCVIP